MNFRKKRFCKDNARKTCDEMSLNGPLVVVVTRLWAVLRAVESLLRIDLLRIIWVSIGLLLWVDWHQILQVQLFLLLAFASKAHS